ncbi:MAG TPA: histidine kinase [Streptosporangiaceae bacterium]|nr:histidine kinase [Streptosporangiaceae bacterium]
MAIVVIIFSIVCAVIAWFRSRGRAGGSPSWRRRVQAMGWGLVLLPVAWIGLWLFGVNPATIGLLLLCGGVLVLAPTVAADLAAILTTLLGLYGLAAAFAVFQFERSRAWIGVARAVPGPLGGQAGAIREKLASAGSVSVVPVKIAPGKAVAVATPPTPPAGTVHIKPIPPHALKIAYMQQVVPLRPGPWYAALAGTGPNGYVPILLAACLFLAFGLWLVPRTFGVHNALVSRLSSRVQRLAETRTDAVDTAAAELRRVERDLHDGAQARLVALGMSLRAAEQVFQTSPKAALALVAEAREMSSRALTELRDLVRGIHPPVLADRGLGDAVRALSLETPVNTKLDIDLPGRLAAPVESAAYFAVAEVLANVAKHAHARMVEIRMRHDGDALRISVTDDGVGGADPAKGSGLRGVERRLGTFDGILAVNSPPGGPTIVVIEVPCALLSLKTSSC